MKTKNKLIIDGEVVNEFKIYHTKFKSGSTYICDRKLSIYKCKRIRSKKQFKKFIRSLKEDFLWTYEAERKIKFLGWV